MQNRVNPLVKLLFHLLFRALLIRARAYQQHYATGQKAHGSFFHEEHPFLKLA